MMMISDDDDDGAEIDDFCEAGQLINRAMDTDGSERWCSPLSGVCTGRFRQGTAEPLQRFRPELESKNS